MKIYTRGGDQGETGLFGGRRVPKSHLRVDAYGTVDELSAALGMAVQAVADSEITRRIQIVQQDLFRLGASLATPEPEEGEKRTRPETPPLPAERIRQMEEWIDAATEETPALREFILPGGSQGAAALHLSRTICRRAERKTVLLGAHERIDPEVVRYLNRLSDLLFCLARLENHRAGIPDVPWRRDDI